MDKNEGKIIESIKHVGFSQNSYRTILPGASYIAPPKTDAKNPFDISDEALFEILKTQELTPKNVQMSFQGLGRNTANELAKLLTDSEQETLKAFRTFFEKSIEPSLTTKSFSAVHFSDSVQSFDSLGELLDYYYKDKEERDRISQQASDLIHRVQTELDKNIKKLAK